MLAALDEPLQVRLKQAEITAAVEDAAVRVVDAAQLPRKPVKPRRLFNLVAATVLGFVVGLLVVLVQAHRDRTLRTRGGVEMATGLPSSG